MSIKEKGKRKLLIVLIVEIYIISDLLGIVCDIIKSNLHNAMPRHLSLCLSIVLFLHNKPVCVCECIH